MIAGSRLGRCPTPTPTPSAAVARSSPWRWTTLRFTERRRRGRTWSEPLRAWLRRPDLLRVEDAAGRLLDVVRGAPTASVVLGFGPWDPPPPVDEPVFRHPGSCATSRTTPSGSATSTWMER